MLTAPVRVTPRAIKRARTHNFWFRLDSVSVPSCFEASLSYLVVCGGHVLSYLVSRQCPE
jgi:hypothetical protein